MIAHELAATRERVCHIVRELGAVLDQLEIAQEVARNPSGDALADGNAIAEALVSAAEAALTAEQHAQEIADRCAALASGKKEAP